MKILQFHWLSDIYLISCYAKLEQSRRNITTQHKEIRILNDMGDFSEDEIEISHKNRVKRKIDDDSDAESDYSQNQIGVLGLRNVSDDEEKEKLKSWGKKKIDFYQEDEESDEELDSDDDSLPDAQRKEKKRALEEKTISRLEKEQQKHLTEKDFELDSDSESDSSDVEEEESEDEVEEFDENDPEFTKYSEELEKSFKLLNTQIKPTLERLKSGKANKEYSFEHGVSYLEAKSQLLLSYCLNLGFYLMLKTKGEKVKNHPVLHTLAEQKTMLEKIRPLDKRIRPQISRVLENQQQMTNNSGQPLVTPTLNQFILSDDEESEEDEEVENIKTFKPSKIAAVHFIDNEKKLEQSQRKIDRRLKRNKLLKEISLGESERPTQLNADMEEVGGDDVQTAKGKQRELEVKRYEEENLTRLRETKKDRKKREALERKQIENNKLGDEAVMSGFDELNFLVNKKKQLVSDAKMNKVQQQESLESFIKDFETEQKKTESSSKSFEMFDPVQAKQAANEESDYEEFYKDVEKHHKSKKVSKDKKRKEHDSKYDRTQTAPTQFANDGTRDAGYKIMKNKGLQPHRKKTDRNPRKRMRTKYEKRVKARQGQVKSMRKKEEGEGYKGEKSGLRSTVITSRRVGNI